MKKEIKTEKEILHGIIREIYDYIENGEEKIKHGLCKYYDSKGNLEEECFYEMGIKNGNVKEYSCGELKAEGNYKAGKKVGEWKKRNYKGEFEKITFIEGAEDEIYFMNKVINKNKRMEILISLGFIAIIIACILQINNFFKEDFFTDSKSNKEIDFPKRYEEKEIEQILEFPEPYSKIKEE